MLFGLIRSMTDAIQAMNIAREYQAAIKQKNNSIATKFLTDTGLVAGNSCIVTDGDYQVTMSIKETVTTDTYHDLHLVHVVVSKESKPISETYTYFEGKVGTTP